MQSHPPIHPLTGRVHSTLPPSNNAPENNSLQLQRIRRGASHHEARIPASFSEERKNSFLSPTCCDIPFIFFFVCCSFCPLVFRLFCNDVRFH
ncbi:hypothetical protein NPIL_159091 [Nephila pilipes]|uniref:Uncharacterized protein n=1 Tax=Nephila pilipes TaxID=299642 RepID=A0A8X6NIE9_NEPPI|nr:hypothetical protein NPIL_159091 [Nephila pilipes]